VTRKLEILLTLLVGASLILAASHGCAGCALVSPEGEASFWSQDITPENQEMPAWPLISPLLVIPKND
jgi:hypothetical protein